MLRTETKEVSRYSSRLNLICAKTRWRLPTRCAFHQPKDLSDGGFEFFLASVVPRFCSSGHSFSLSLTHIEGTRLLQSHPLAPTAFTRYDRW